MSRIYVASSWRNPWQQDVVSILRSLTHSVYDFRNPAVGHRGFSWDELNDNWQDWSPQEYRDALVLPRAREAFSFDMRALESADICVLVQPCGISSHLELGWAAGAEKRTAVLFPDWEAEDGSLPEVTVKAELMAKVADAILLGRAELEAWL